MDYVVGYLILSSVIAVIYHGLPGSVQTKLRGALGRIDSIIRLLANVNKICEREAIYSGALNEIARADTIEQAKAIVKRAKGATLNC